MEDRLRDKKSQLISRNSDKTQETKHHTVHFYSKASLHHRTRSQHHKTGPEKTRIVSTGPVGHNPLHHSPTSNTSARQSGALAHPLAACKTAFQVASSHTVFHPFTIFTLPDPRMPAQARSTKSDLGASAKARSRTPRRLMPG